jgi:hypothetical protein
MKPGDLSLHLEAYVALRRAVGFALGAREKSSKWNNTCLPLSAKWKFHRGNCPRDGHVVVSEDQSAIRLADAPLGEEQFITCQNV